MRGSVLVFDDEPLITDHGYWVLIPGLTLGEHRLTIRTPAWRQRPSVDWTLTAT
ncbi:hypothetical protein NE236_12450 [Actinoallomurus purpureus]|uniref:hypothetical protein n=1 Tax=Actinoallomurus purpureus TaxID=478114 RepID=UPI002092E2FE|nr:hypothetical protein [Actinoallomurus purpureus]MCO6005795.1 hypothetical protein [Actinoallomurus purpureus]